MKFNTFVLFLTIIYRSSICFAQVPGSMNPLNDRYAVVIGISDYKDKSHNLMYPSKDANDIYSALMKSGRFAENNIKLLIDSLATRENIRQSIEGWLQSKAQKDNLAFIFYSGHGSQNEDNDGDEEDGMDEYLVPFDYDATDISSGICDDVFASWIRNLKSDNVFIMFDCCYSGGAAKQKGFSPPGLKGKIIEDDFLKEIPRDGVALMAASQPNQVSWEDNKLKNGVFVHYFIDAISDPSDVNFDYVLNEEELFFNLKNKVKTYVKDNFNQAQEPVLIKQLSSPLDLFYLSDRINIKPNIDSVKLVQYQLEQINKGDNYNAQLMIREKLYRYAPEDLENIKRIAELSLYLEKFDKALVFYEILNNANNKNAYANLIAKIYLTQDKYRRAIEWADKCLEKSEDITGIKVDALLGLQDTSRALELLRGSLSEKLFQKTGYIKMFYIYLARGAYKEAQSFLGKYRNINPNDLETLYWTGMFEKYVNRNSMVGDSILKEFYNEDHVKSDLGSLEAGFYGSFITKYPYLKEGYKKMIIWAEQKGKKELRLKYLNLYKLCGKFDLDKEFVRQEEDRSVGTSK